jgi:hypothetical protein
MMSVQIREPKATISVLAFSDEGSNITLLDSTLVQGIGASGELMPLCCNWMKGISHYDDNFRKIQFEISTDFESQEIHTINNVRTMKNFDLPVMSSILMWKWKSLPKSVHTLFKEICRNCVEDNRAC